MSDNDKALKLKALAREIREDLGQHNVLDALARELAASRLELADLREELAAVRRQVDTVALVQKGNNLNGLLLGLARTPPDFNNFPYKVNGLHRSYRYPNPANATDDRVYDNPFWVMNEDRNTSNVGRAFGNMQIDYDEETAHAAVQKIYDLARGESSSPFFLTVSFTHPHPPFVARQEEWDRYADADIDPPAVPEIPFAELDPHIPLAGGDRVSPAAALARAHKDFRVDLQLAAINESDLLAGPIGRDAVCYRAAELCFSHGDDPVSERKAKAYGARYQELRAAIVVGALKPQVVALDKSDEVAKRTSPATLFYGFGFEPRREEG